LLVPEKHHVALIVDVERADQPTVEGGEADSTAAARFTR
jgi:hypothetical protein